MFQSANRLIVILVNSGGVTKNNLISGLSSFQHLH